MIQCVNEADKTRPYRAQISGFDGERFEEVLDLLDRFDRRFVLNGFTREPQADYVDRATSNLQDRSPGGLECDRGSRFGEGGIETAECRLAAFAGDSNNEPREAIEPRVEHNDTCELEEATECRHRQHAVRIIESNAYPVCGSCQWSEKQYPEDADDQTK